MTLRRSWFLASHLLLTLACDTENPNEAKRMPKPPPPESSAHVAIAPIPVVLDGQPGPTIDQALLDQKKPDFQDEERRAWSFSSLLGPRVDQPGAVISVTGDKGIVLELPRTSGDKAPLPVLVVSRRGHVMAAMIEPDDPFPSYHGRGGRLGRRGDPLPRISGVTRVELLHR